MKLLFEDDLVEAVVFLRADGRRPGVPALQIHRFHAERERCYATLDLDDRAAAFARVQLAWFTEWGVPDRLGTVATRFPQLQAALASLAFRKASGRNEEGAELYRNADGARQGVVALKPGRFAGDAALERLLHHELAHLADMVDEAFGYSPDLDGTAGTASQQRLVRERYRLLWNVSVDGRLTRRGLETVADEARRRDEFERAFAFLSEPRRRVVFDDLWQGRLARHSHLLEVASSPRGFAERHAPVPGALCPLCGFAAFEWTDGHTLRPEAIIRIRTEFPAWQEAEAICARCAEIYESVSGQSYPATVCV